MSDLPDNWNLVDLEIVCKIQTGKKDVDEGNPAGKYIFFTCAAIPTRSDIYSFDGESILLPGNGANVGMSIYFNGKFEAYQRTYVLNQFSEYGKYVFYYFQHYWVKHLYGKQYGSAVNYVRMGNFTSFQIPIPPLNEQKRIAKKLDTLLARVDSCQTHLEHVPQILKRFRQSVLAAATSGRLTEDWREKKGMDGEWEETDVQSVAFVGTGSTPLRSNSSFYASKGTPWVTSAATGQTFIHEAKEFVTKEAIKTHRLKLFPIGTVIVAMYGEGKTRGQVSELAIEATINQACAAIVVDETKVAKKYLKLTLQANYLEMRELAEGGNQPNLNLSKIKEFTFSLPSPEEQAEIVRRVEKLFAYAERLEARYTSASEHVERLTPSLLAKAFRGELVSQEQG